MHRQLLSSDDLTEEDVETLLDLAAQYERGREPRSTPNSTVGLLFYETSLRTRVGFTVASHRLGLSTVEVYEPRQSEISLPESWIDTLRITSGYCSALVARPGASLDRGVVGEHCACPCINGGDLGDRAEHPTQALLDLYAIRVLAPRRPLRIVVWGDPTMRAARSLLKLLRRTDHELYIVSDSRFLKEISDHHPVTVEPEHLPQIGVDVLYVTGMRHQSIPLARRDELIVKPSTLSALPESALVLSPMPVIDEIAPETRSDPRVKMQRQSDLGLYVRMAVLNGVLEAS